MASDGPPPLTIRAPALGPPGDGLDDLVASNSPSDLTNYAPHQLQPKGERRCAQCRGEDDDATLHHGEGYPPEGTWLHRECVRFWRQDHRLTGKETTP